MKCPHCKYENGWNEEKLKNIIGKVGDFYKLSNNIKMERSTDYGEELNNIYGCPFCNKVFIG